jgi:selenocysteine lyase/cysteine desulfurase
MLDFQLRDLGCDFYAASFHKWMNGSHGTGMLHVSRPNLERLWPIEPRGIDIPPVPTPTIAAGQHGVPAALHKLGNIVPLAWPALRGAEVAVDFQQQIMRSRIEARVRELVYRSPVPASKHACGNWRSIHACACRRSPASNC